MTGLTQDELEEFVPFEEEVRRQCASCPFREDNDKAFGEFVKKVDPPARWTAASLVLGEAHLLAQKVERKRREVREDTIESSGSFACHNTAFDRKGEDKPLEKWKQCKGATKFYDRYLAETLRVEG